MSLGNVALLAILLGLKGEAHLDQKQSKRRSLWFHWEALR